MLVKICLSNTSRIREVLKVYIVYTGSEFSVQLAANKYELRSRSPT